MTNLTFDHISALASFLAECTEPDPAAELKKQELYDSWTKWSRERRIPQVSMMDFMRQVAVNAPTAKSDSYEKDGSKCFVYRGLKLKRGA